MGERVSMRKDVYTWHEGYIPHSALILLSLLGEPKGELKATSCDSWALSLRIGISREG